MFLTQTLAILLTGKLAKLIAIIDSFMDQSYNLFTTSLEDHHFEEYQNDPGEDASVIRNNWQIVETQANVSEQSYREDEHSR